MKKAVIILSIVLGIVCLAVAAFAFIDVPFTNYYKGQYYAMINNEEKSIEAYESADGYKDSEEILKEAAYQNALELIEKEEYDEAGAILDSMPNYKDSATLIDSVKYGQAKTLYEQGDLKEAAEMFIALGDYEDSKELLAEITMSTILWFDCADTYACIVNEDNTVSVIGEASSSKIRNEISTVEGWTDIIAVEASDENIIGLKSDGTVVGVGIVHVDVYDIFINGTEITTMTRYEEADIHNYNEYSFATFNGMFTYEGDDLVFGIDVLEDVKFIKSFRNDYIAGLRNDGSAFSAGHGKKLVNLPLDLDNAVAIAPSEFYTIILLDDGTVVFSTPEFTPESMLAEVEKSRPAENWTDIISIDSGSMFSIGLKSDGTVISVGSNANGQRDVDDWQDIIAVATGDTHTVGLKSDGTVVAVGDNSKGQCDVDTWDNIIAIAASDYLTVGIMADGTIVCTEKMDAE